MFLADGFDGQELERSPVFRYINHLSMSQRRRMIFIMMSDRFKTMDEMMAYAMSANVVINPKDVDKIHTIFKKAVSDHEKLYKVFFEIMEETGRV
jgi:hypothetical protein